MMFLFLVSGWGLANAACPLGPVHLEAEGLQKVEERLVLHDRLEGCKRIDLGNRAAMTIDKIRVRIKSANEKVVNLGAGRVAAVGGRWILQMPELRPHDEIRLRLWAESLPVEPVWTALGAESLGPPEHTTIRWVDGGDFVFGPGGSVSRHTEQRWQTETSRGGVWQYWLAAGAQNIRCSAQVDGEDLPVSVDGHGCGFQTPNAGTLSAEMSWTQNGASASAEWTLGPGSALIFPDNSLRWAGIEPTAGKQGLHFEGPGFLSTMLTHLDGQEVPVVAMAEVEAGARNASIPVPGLGLAYKGRTGGLEMLEEILGLVREQIQTGTLVGGHPLKPRRLMAVKRSGWGTPWEQALLLSRYLDQIGLESQAFPVRPTTTGAGLTGAPDGYTAAVVRATEADKIVWMEPSCAECAVGELSADLWGGAVFSGLLRHLPKAPAQSVK